MKLIIRDITPDDIPATAALVSEVVPYMITTPGTVQWGLRNAPAAQRFRVTVAEVEGEIVGTARMGLFHDSTEPGPSHLNVNVPAAHRRRGVGGALLADGERYLEDLGATRVQSWALEEDDALSFAAGHGYRQERGAQFLRLDLSRTELPQADPPPAGVELLPATAFEDDPRPLYAVDAETGTDEPRSHETELAPYEEWLAQRWERPDLDRELSTVAVVDGEAAAFTYVQTDGRRRYWSGGTGTRRAFRGRGLAKLVKLDSLRRAAAAGYTDAYTNNATGNAPMLAVNDWLGYRLAAAERLCVRDLG